MRERKIRSIFVIEPSLKQRAEEMAKEQAISYSEFVRRAILVYLGGDLSLEERITAVEKMIDEIKQRQEAMDDWIQERIHAKAPS